MLLFVGSESEVKWDGQKGLAGRKGLLSLLAPASGYPSSRPLTSFDPMILCSPFIL